MSKHSPLVALIGFLFLLNSCTKDKQDNLSDTPTAKAEHNSSNYGIYKGVFIGSSGTVLIDVNNDNDNALSATLNVDGTEMDFTSNSVVTANQQSTIGFTSGSNSFTFTVSGNGSTPLVTNLVINGHPASEIILLKETSTFVVKCFEGSFDGDDSGTINAVMWGNDLRAVIKSSSLNGFDHAFSVVSNGQINAGLVTTGATFTGTVSGNSMSGTWQNTQFNEDGSWSASRTY